MHGSTRGFANAILMIREGDTASDRFRELLQSAFEQKLLTPEVIASLREKASEQGQEAQGLIDILDAFKNQLSLSEAKNESKDDVKEAEIKRPGPKS